MKIFYHKVECNLKYSLKYIFHRQNNKYIDEQQNFWII
jgi:hypothetical protein